MCHKKVYFLKYQSKRNKKNKKTNFHVNYEYKISTLCVIPDSYARLFVCGDVRKITNQ